MCVCVCVCIIDLMSHPAYDGRLGKYTLNFYYFFLFHFSGWEERKIVLY